MSDERGITRYELMPIPPVESQTRWFEAGAVAIGVEYRVLDDAVAAASEVAAAGGTDPGVTTGVDDRGVSIHVCGVRGGERLEHLRFDCFEEDPHYHYVSWDERRNEMIHIDPVADGDPLEWTLSRLRTRLPQMLARAGAADVARGVDPAAVEAILPRVAEAAYRTRFEHDDEAVRRSALGGDAA